MLFTSQHAFGPIGTTNFAAHRPAIRRYDNSATGVKNFRI